MTGQPPAQTSSQQSAAAQISFGTAVTTAPAAKPPVSLSYASVTGKVSANDLSAKPAVSGSIPKEVQQNISAGKYTPGASTVSFGSLSSQPTSPTDDKQVLKYLNDLQFITSFVF